MRDREPSDEAQHDQRQQDKQDESEHGGHSTVRWLPIRIAANGRHEVRCSKCLNLFWLTAAELAAWTACPHCFGWWTFGLEGT